MGGLWRKGFIMEKRVYEKGIGKGKLGKEKEKQKLNILQIKVEWHKLKQYFCKLCKSLSLCMWLTFITFTYFIKIT